jgi:hypothetical protein
MRRRREGYPMSSPRAARLVRVAAILVACAGCGSPSQPVVVVTPDAPTSNGPLPHTARVVYAFTWPLEPDVAASITDDGLAELAARGFVLHDGVLSFPEAPSAGAVLHVDGADLMVTPDGTLDVPDITDSRAQLFEELDVPTPMWEGDLRDLPREDGVLVLRVRRALKSPGDMNPDSIVAMTAHEHAHAEAAEAATTCKLRGNVAAGLCAAGNNRPKGCCVDYNNPFGDGMAYDRNTTDGTCQKQAIWNFVLSTCFAWTSIGVCAQEAAFMEGPSCWNHHKYRNCQNLKVNDLSASPAKMVLDCGESMKFDIHNNTPGNSTIVTNQEGTFANAGGNGAVIAKGAHVYQVQHYSDARQLHYEDMHLTYTAPGMDRFPHGVTTITDDVELASAASLTHVSITINCPCSACDPDCEQCGLDLNTGQAICLPKCDMDNCQECDRATKTCRPIDCGECQQCAMGGCQPVPDGTACGPNGSDRCMSGSCQAAPIPVYCACNHKCYTSATPCLEECHVGLGCFTGICGPATPEQCPP